MYMPIIVKVFPATAKHIFEKKANKRARQTVSYSCLAVAPAGQ